MSFLVNTYKSVVGVIGTVSSFTAMGWGAFKYYQNSSHRRYVRNVTNKLDFPFTPKNPFYGPLFQRESWNKSFIESLDKSFKPICYYGSPQEGKSLAITQALKGRRGVVYISFKSIYSPESIPLSIARQIGYFGSDEFDPTVPLEILFRSIEDACYEFKLKNDQKIVFIIDDIIKYDLHVAYLTLIVGQRYMTSQYFHPYPEQELATELMRLSLANKDYKFNSPPGTKSKYEIQFSDWAFFEADKIPDTHSFVFNSEDEVQLLIRHFGSNMRSLTEVLQLFVEKKLSVPEIIDAEINYMVPVLSNIFLKNTVRDKIVDRNLFVGIVKNIFDKLSTPGSRTYDDTFNDNIVTNYDIIPPNCKHVEEVMLVVDLLTTYKILTYVDWDMIKFNNRIMRYTYRHLRKNSLFNSLLENGEELSGDKSGNKANNNNFKYTTPESNNGSNTMNEVIEGFENDRENDDADFKEDELYNDAYIE